MEQNAKRLLIQELDKSLLDHTAALGQKEGGPRIGDAYELQALAERHYYLKVKHEFTPTEVEALLAFADPLKVAQNCWEENSHEHSFPICEILDSIGAYARFPLKDLGDHAQGQEQVADAVDAVKEAMEWEMNEYRSCLLDLSKEEIISKSQQTASMQSALEFMKHGYKFETGDAETLLNMEKPLSFIANEWPTDMPGLIMPDLLPEILETARTYQKGATAPAQGDRPSVLDQLHSAKQEASQRPTGDRTVQTQHDPR